jgi:hypothetical protein
LLALLCPACPACCCCPLCPTAPKQPPGSTPTSTAGNEQPPDPAAAAANNAGSNGGSSPAAAGGGGLIPTLGPIAAPPAPVLFGDPFLLRVGPQETVGEVRGRIQQKLGVSAADFEAWRVAFMSVRAAPHYLAGELGRRCLCVG